MGGSSEERKDRIRVGAVDDHDLMVAGVRALLSTQNSPARFVAGADSVAGLLRIQPVLDVVVLEVRLHDASRPEDNIGTLKSRGMAVLLHTDRSHREAGPILLRAGASGLVWKNDPAVHLLRAIVAVAHGEQWMPVGGPHAVNLTNRETEVLRLYATGMRYAEVAARLQPAVSVESVKTYLSRIRKRYADAHRPASTRMELRRRALEDGLLPPE
jgi:DNA-binding NarL/FixJ family response regulator